MAKKHITSRPGLFGTIYYYDENGKPIGKSHPGLFEGTRVYTGQNGRYAGKSRPGFLAKEVFTDADHNHITSYDSLYGEVHSKNGVPIGHSRPGFFDSAHITWESEDDCSEEYCEDSFEECAEDSGEYNPEVSQYAVVRNLQLFILCLVICMVIFGVYAIIRLN